jgi:hypothetical protein
MQRAHFIPAALALARIFPGIADATDHAQTATSGILHRRPQPEANIPCVKRQAAPGPASRDEAPRLGENPAGWGLWPLPPPAKTVAFGGKVYSHRLHGLILTGGEIHAPRGRGNQGRGRGSCA